MAAATYSMFRLRGICTKYNKRLRRSVQAVYDKQEHIHQLQDKVSSVSSQAEAMQTDLETAQSELESRTLEMNQVQEKLNENYRLVATLSSENLKLSGEKIKADDLVAQVIQEQGRLKEELTKALKVVDSFKSEKTSLENSSSEGCLLKPYHPDVMRSSPETSSSFDFIPRSAMDATLTPVPSGNEATLVPDKSPHKRGRYPNHYRGGRGRGRRWRGPGYQSDVGQNSPRPQGKRYHQPKDRLRPQSSATMTDDVSSPDLGVDMGSDAFSSLERRMRPDPSRIVEENRKLNQKVNQFKGVLRTTIDKLSEPVIDEPVLPEEARNRLFPPSQQSQQEQRAKFKKDCIEFSRSHGSRKSGKGKRSSSKSSNGNKQ